MITIKEIAAKLEVSPTTVSNVINGHTEKMSEKTRRRIEEALVKYEFKKGMPQGNPGNGLKLVSVDFSIRFREKIFMDPFCAELLDSICVNLQEYGRYPVCGKPQSQEEAHKKLQGLQYRGRNHCRI